MAVVMALYIFFLLQQIVRHTSPSDSLGTYLKSILPSMLDIPFSAAVFALFDIILIPFSGLLLAYFFIRFIVAPNSKILKIFLVVFFALALYTVVSPRVSSIGFCNKYKTAPNLCPSFCEIVGDSSNNPCVPLY